MDRRDWPFAPRCRARGRYFQKIEGYILRFRWYYTVTAPLWLASAVVTYLNSGVCAWLFISVMGFVSYVLYAVYGWQRSREADRMSLAKAARQEEI